MGHAHTFRSSMRASFGTVYSWLDDVRSARAQRVSLPGHVWWQLFEAACLLPLAQLRRSSPWSNRLVTTDAARAKGAAGQGLAYTYLKGGEVQRWSRFCSSPGDLRASRLTVSIMRGLLAVTCTWQTSTGRHWHEQGRPRLDRHITLEGLAAQVWGVEGRLHFPSETEARCLHGGDNTAAVSATAKGRSSCRAMHALCRKLNAISLAGGLRCFWFYIPSAKNPSDRASRIALQQQHRSMISLAVSTLPMLVFVHAFSGRRLAGDLEFWLREYAAEYGIQIVAVSIDMNVAKHLDMLSNKLFSQLRCWCWSGRVFGWHGGPPATLGPRPDGPQVALLPSAVVACHLVYRRFRPS